MEYPITQAEGDQCCRGRSGTRPGFYERCPISRQWTWSPRRMVLRTPPPSPARLGARRRGHDRARTVGRKPPGQQLLAGQLALPASSEPPGQPLSVGEGRQCGGGPVFLGAARQPCQCRHPRSAGDCAAPLAHVSGVGSPLAPGGGEQLSANRRIGFVVVRFDAAAADLPAGDVKRVVDTAGAFARPGLQVAVGGALRSRMSSRPPRGLPRASGSSPRSWSCCLPSGR